MFGMRIVVGTVKYFKKRALGGSLNKPSSQAYKISKWKVIWTYIKSLLKSIFRKSVSLLLPAYSFSKDYKILVLGDDASEQSQNYHYFIGYYDIDPFNDWSQTIVCHRVLGKYSSQVLPEFGDIGLLSVATGKFEKLQDSRAVNWQLGTRVQWLDNEHLIYNDIQDGNQVSRKLNVTTNAVVKEYHRAFWAISPDKKLGASLNFSRIRMKRPGYGYNGYSTDGDTERLTLFNLATGIDEYTVELSDILLEINYDPDGKDPYLNHIAWSPCSTKLLSLFHFAESGNGVRKVYPIVFDLVHNTWRCIDENGFFSHHTWLDASSILAYKQFQGKERYCIWNIDSGWSVISDSMPITDGHPSPVNTSDRIIVDSYPNRLGMMKLYLGSSQSRDKYSTIGFVVNPPEYTGPLRCDLHPRVCKGNSKVICDIPTFEGRRILLIEGTYDE